MDEERGENISYELAQDDVRLQEKPSCTCFKRHWKVLVCVLGFAMIVLLGVTRTLLLIARKTTQGLHWSECESNENLSNQTSQEESSKDDGESYFHMTDLLYIVHSLLHWPEYVFLAYGTCKLVYAMDLWDEDSVTKIKKETKKLLCKWHTVAASAVIVIFVVASLAVPLLSITEACVQSERHPNCPQQSFKYKVHHVYQVLSFLSHIVSPGIRIYMAVMVVVVQAIWIYEVKAPEKGTQTPTSAGDTAVSDDQKCASSKYFEHVLDYERRQDKITIVLKVFRAWFVIQWFIYYFQFLVDLSRVLRPWLGDGLIFDLEHTRRLLYAVYDLLAFIIPHVCGLKMNEHHETFLSTKRCTLLKDSKDERKQGTQVCYAIASTLHIEKCKTCDFIPAIPWTGISIPLDSPSYALGILLTIFALTGSFVLK